jgi:Dolichyl-phosphate-mannose-protein mannosyltransferase
MITKTVSRMTYEPRSNAAGRPLNVWAWLWGICALALVLRLGAIVFLQAWTHPNPMEHKLIALHLFDGNGFSHNDWGMVAEPTSVQSPLFPYLLYTGFKVFGRDATAAYVAIMILNAFMGAASCALTYAMTRALRGGPAVGLIAAGLVAVWPTQIYAVASVQAITFITCCSIAAVWLFYASVDSRRLTPWIAYGIVGCLGALTEPVLLPFMALSGLLILAWPGVPVGIRFRNAVALFFCAVLILGPWMVRNYNVHETLMPVKSTFWVNVWKGNNPNATGTDRLELTDEQIKALQVGLTDAQLRDPDFDGLRQYAKLSPQQKAELTGKPEVEREKIFARYAKTYISDHPDEYVRLSGIRLWKTLWVESGNPKAHGTKQYLFYWTPRTLLLVLTPVALVVAWRRRWRLTIPLLVAGTALLMYTLTIAAARFALPYEPWQLALIAGLFARLPAQEKPA